MIRKRRIQKENPTPKTEVEKTKLTTRHLHLENYRKPSEQLFPNRRSLSYLYKNEHKVQTAQTFDFKTLNKWNHNRNIALERSVI